jgi:hypothetical protein
MTTLTLTEAEALAVWAAVQTLFDERDQKAGFGCVRLVRETPEHPDACATLNAYHGWTYCTTTAYASRQTAHEAVNVDTVMEDGRKADETIAAYLKNNRSQ